MSNWKRLVFPISAAVVLIVAMASWELPQVRAAFSGLSQPGSALTITAQAQAQDQKPFIGISLVNNTAQLKSRLNLPIDTGVVIFRVAQGSPGDQAGLKQNDVITSVDGKAASTAQDVTRAVQAKKVGDSITLTVQRSDGSHDIKVTLGAAPQPAPNAGPKGPNGVPFGGLGGFLGANPAQNLQNATITIKDKDGNTRTLNIVAGKIASVDANGNSISVTPNGGSTASGFTITSNTQTGRVKVSDMKVGDQVIVVAENGNALQVHDLPATATNGGMMPNGPKNMPFHRFGTGRGGQQPQQPNQQSRSTGGSTF